MNLRKTIKLLLLSIIILAPAPAQHAISAEETPSLQQKKYAAEHYSWRQVKVNGGGYTNFILTDPASPNIVYAGIDVGGIYRSRDYGENWFPANKGLDWPSDRLVAALAIDSNSGALYLGAGGYGKGGIFRSTDKGESWRLLTRKVIFNSRGVQQSRGRGLIVIDPTGSGAIYAGSYKDGLFRSVDGGKTWSYRGLKGKRISSILVNPVDPEVIYVSSVDVRGSKDLKGGIFKSVDGGINWKRTAKEIVDVYQLAMDPKNPDIIYAACGSRGIFRTTDGGGTWLKKNTGLDGMGLIVSRLNFRKTRYLTVEIDKSNPELIFTGSGDKYGQVYRSENRGEQWTRITGKKNILPGDSWFQERQWLGNTGSSVNCISIDPRDSKRIYISGRGGVWRSDNAGATWRPKVRGLEATVMNRVVLNPRQRDVFYAANTDWVFFYSMDGGKTMLRTLNGMGNWDIKKDKKIYRRYRMKNGRDFAIDPRTVPGTVYIGGDAGNKNSGTVFKSPDGGGHWKEANSGLPVAGVSALSSDPDDYDTLYAALRGKGVYKTTDGGKSWRPVNKGLPDPEGLFRNYLNEILVHPADPEIIYILDKGKGIYKTTDRGKDWEIISNSLPETGLRGMRYYSGGLAVDPEDPDIVYAGLYGKGIYRTTDGGKSWKRISPPYITNAGTMDTDPRDGAVYVVSVPEAGEEDIKDFIYGIYKSIDKGNTWKAIDNDELLRISLKIKDITVDPHYRGRIYLSTMGNGIIVGEPGGDKLLMLHRR